MSKHSPINDRIKLQASTWVSRLNRGLTDDEKPQLIAWINQDPAHHRAVYNVATFFDNIEQLKELNGVFPIEKSQQQQARKKATFFCLMMLTIVSVLWSMHWYVNSSNRANTPQIYASDLGKREQITLSDGSIVTLNSASMIKVSYRRDHRLVNLLKGEAQFDVESDPTRPFTVTVGTQSFTALGTIFNVQKNNESDMELLVTEGQVLVANAALEQRALIDLITVEKAKFMSTRIITSGEEAIIENSQ
jgi:transmembrane sensor